jgi:hypothetical protein
MVEAADLYQRQRFFAGPSPGIAKSLGDPRASIVPLSGVNAEVVVTVAWDISWYQYRVTPESGQPVRLAERGHDPARARGDVHEVEREADARRADRAGHLPGLALS